ncbi:MAG: hypothetical protein AAB974_02570 [Patescibacteria group bacterium]
MRMRKALPAAAAGIALAGTLASASLVYAHDGGVGAVQRPRLDKTEIQAMIAEDLGITVDQLKQKIDAGQKPGEIAKELGITPEQMKEKMIARATAEIQARVASGKLTQEQADKILERMANHPKPGKMMRHVIKHRFNGNGNPPPHFEKFKEIQAQ